MMNSPDLAFVPSDRLGSFTDQLRLAVAAYLARFKGASREHTTSDLRCFLTWCAGNGLDPLTARRPHLELYIRWMQEIRRFKPSTVSRRFSVAAGFYRTCVIDGILQHSPAEHVRRPTVPPESPTLGFTHLQFEALLTAARESPNPSDFALVAMLGLLGLRIFEATGADITDLGEEHGHRVLMFHGPHLKKRSTSVMQRPLSSKPRITIWRYASSCAKRTRCHQHVRETLSPEFAWRIEAKLPLFLPGENPVPHLTELAEEACRAGGT
jgi:site-specific recombinase XerD